MSEDLNNKFQKLKSSEIDSANDLYDVIVVNTFFEVSEIQNHSVVSEKEIINRINISQNLIDKAAKLLKDGGLLFVYGLPKHLPFYAVNLNKKEIDEHHFLFKYWIALEFENKDLGQPLPNSHVGMLMYLKTKSLEKPTPFKLNTKKVRVPYAYCSYCGENIKDWGGKKHLLNGMGAAYSDVWVNLRDNIESSRNISDNILEHIHKLTYSKDDYKMLVIEQEKINYLDFINDTQEDNYKKNFQLDEDEILHYDSLKLMKEYVEIYPQGIFDLVFADPPYNLDKNYNGYHDSQSDIDYISWCNEWLDLMSQILRPGGSLFVLNIPKWAVYHAEFLNKKLEFRHWIVWDALSTPTGKLMPAHYALLYYTKSGGNITVNKEEISPIDSREYCLRNTCIKRRKKKKKDNKEEVTDIWHDIHRIKHKKDRDSHPCQLPLKLMDRIVKMASNKEDWVYDPFGGAGTTAISAKINERHFVISDIDEKYVEISKRNIKKIQEDKNGQKHLVRKSIQKKLTPVTKKEIEIAFLEICNDGTVPNEEQLRKINPHLYKNIVDYYSSDFKSLSKMARRRLEIKKEKELDK